MPNRIRKSPGCTAAAPRRHRDPARGVRRRVQRRRGRRHQARGADTTLTLVAYAVPEPGWSKIIPAFAATPEGKGVAVTTSYGASGDQSRGVVDGKPADIVNFSVEPDVTRLVKANKVAKDWNADATKGIPFGSVVSLVVRKGNPKNIKDWDDLLQARASRWSPRAR